MSDDDGIIIDYATMKKLMEDVFIHRMGVVLVYPTDVDPTDLLDVFEKLEAQGIRVSRSMSSPFVRPGEAFILQDQDPGMRRGGPLNGQ